MRNTKASRYSVLLLSILAFLLPTIWIECKVLQSTHGTVAYPMDYAFLHLSVAKNLAFEHVWGVTKDSFTSASSSPLYTLVLASLFLITGAYLIVPLLLNGVIAILFLGALHRWLVQQESSPVSQLLILLTVIFLVPLPLLVISGMEYTLELFFSFLFISYFSQTVSKGNPFPSKVYIFGLLMVTTSYETIPILLIAGILLLMRRQGWEAFKLVSISLLPIYLFGLFALTKHNYIVPNPVLLTWSMTSLNGIWHNLSFVLTLPLICFLLFCTLRQQGRKLKPPQRPKWLIYSLLLILIVPLAFLSVNGFSQASQRCVDVYTGQYQAAKFLRAYYYRDHVAANNIGVVSFCSDNESIMDLAGIGDLEVLKQIRTHSWSPAMADSFAERSNVKVAVLHGGWSDKDTDPYWYKIACWQISNDSVSFYSIDSRGIDKLQKDLHEYESRLPVGVTVRYY